MSQIAMTSRINYLASLTAVSIYSSSMAGNAVYAQDRDGMIERDAQIARGEIEGPRLIVPDRFDSIGTLLPQLYAVVRGTVADISYDYLDCQGPRTVVKLTMSRH